jgi:hypothetical protein
VSIIGLLAQIAVECGLLGLYTTIPACLGGGWSMVLAAPADVSRADGTLDRRLYVLPAEVKSVDVVDIAASGN